MSKPLSPAAQAVEKAAYTAWVAQDDFRPIAAAAIRAFAEQCAYTARCHPENSELNVMVIDEADAIAIAAELEAS